MQIWCQSESAFCAVKIGKVGTKCQSWCTALVPMHLQSAKIGGASQYPVVTRHAKVSCGAVVATRKLEKQLLGLSKYPVKPLKMRLDLADLKVR